VSNQSGPRLSELTTDIVAAYMGKQKVAPKEIPYLITEVHKALVRTLQRAAQPIAEVHEPAVPIKQSVKKDYLVCLECGKQFKALKRHLRNEHDMTAEEYRTKWGLPRDYPTVAPNYAEVRSNMAKAMGLGRKAPAAAKKSASKRSRR
jgi:predicted transcriptional regulator